jgi:hypothetical protein
MKKIIIICPLVIMGLLFAFTTNCKKDSDSSSAGIKGKIAAVFNASKTYGTMTDQDGNTNKTIVKCFK